MTQAYDSRQTESGTSWAARLLELSTATDRIMQSIFLGDRIATLNEIARQSHLLLRAEACAIFLVDENLPDTMLKVAWYSDNISLEADAHLEPVRIKIQSVPSGGLTGHIAKEGDIVELHGEELRHHAYSAGLYPNHLASGFCHSLLGIPLKDRKGALLGLMVADNKKGPDGKSKDDEYFTKEDISVANILASKITLVLESQRTSEILRTLLTETHRYSSVSEVLDAILQEGLKLLRADRGDLALIDEDSGGLVMMARRGDLGLEPGEMVPADCVMQHVFRTGDSRAIPDVHLEPHYTEVDRRTQSEVAVRLEWEGRSIGVLNVESFDASSFDEQDVALLRLLASYAVVAYRAVGREMRFRHVIQRLAGSHPPQQVLLDILKIVKSIHPYEGSIIYYADYQEGKLICKAYITSKVVDNDACAKLSYDFSDSSFATLILNSKQPEFVPAPLVDPRVNRIGLEAFKIDGPLAGIPLTFQDKVVGVLVMWTAAEQSPLTKGSVAALEPFARIAAANIAMSSQQDMTMRSMEVMLNLSRTELPLQNKLESILELVKAAGFDRVRVFRFHLDTNSFRPVAALPKDNPIDFQECVIAIKENPYAKDTFERGRRDPVARIYDSRLHGPDPHAKRLGKAHDLPWVVIPIVIAGKLFGQIAADNAESRRPIPDDNLPYLTLLGTFAALAIANTRVYERLSLPGLHLLYRQLPEDLSELAYVRRLLVYLTCGEALGFSRALFLRFDGSRRRLEYVAGLGQITRDDFVRISKAAETLGMETIIARAGELRDPNLDGAMAGFYLDVEDPVMSELIDGKDARRFTLVEDQPALPWMEKLKEKIQAVDILAAPVRVNGKLAGLFCIDRQWLNETISEADRALLGAFANQAGLFLHSCALRQEAIEQLRRAVRKEANSFAAHRIKTPILNIQGSLRLFEAYVERRMLPAAVSVVRDVRPNIEKIHQIVEDSLVVSEFVSEPTPIAPLVRDVISSALSEGFFCRVSCEPDLKVQGDRKLLLECFEELIANARYWTTKPHGAIDIAAQAIPPPEDTASANQRSYVGIRVKNTGDGVPNDKKKWIFLDGKTTREGGNGRGLARVADIIKAHDGRISEIGEPGKFALFEIVLPLA